MFNIMKEEDFIPSQVKVDILVNVMQDEKKEYITSISDFYLIKHIITVKHPSTNTKGFYIPPSQIMKMYEEISKKTIELKCSSVAIHIHNLVYPMSLFLSVAISSSDYYFEKNDIDVTFVISNFDFGRSSKKLNTKLHDFIQQNYDSSKPSNFYKLPIKPDPSYSSPKKKSLDDLYFAEPSITYWSPSISEEVNKQISNAGKDFSKYLIELMEKKNLTSETVYKNGNLDRKYFSKLLNDKIKNPSKEKLLLLAIGLQLDYNESIDLLNFMGYSFSNNSVIDLIFKFYIMQHEYNIYHINSEIFAYTGKCLVGDE